MSPSERPSPRCTSLSTQAPAGVDAEVLECPPERRPVALRSLAQELASEGGEGHPEKLRRRQHGRGEGE